jgi:hypothetical protein
LLVPADPRDGSVEALLLARTTEDGMAHSRIEVGRQHAFGLCLAKQWNDRMAAGTTFKGIEADDYGNP